MRADFLAVRKSQCTLADSCLVFNPVGILLRGLLSVFVQALAWRSSRFMRR
jgi:hypothetical protein